MLDLIVEELDISRDEVFALPGPLDLRGLFKIADLSRQSLQYPAFLPRTNAELAEVETADEAEVMAVMRERDVLLHHPYDSFSTSVQAFLEQAATDPRVLAIKQTLYRTSGDSPIVDALIDAAGPASRSWSWLRSRRASTSRRTSSGPGSSRKPAATSSTAWWVSRRTASSRWSCGRTTTASGATPTSAPATTTRALPGSTKTSGCSPLTPRSARTSPTCSTCCPATQCTPSTKFLVAPHSIRLGLVERIEREIENHRAGRPAGVRFKVNSIVDEGVIDALYRASLAGLPVKVWVRICAIRAGVKDLSESLVVRSILGRFLEHSRIFEFENAGDPQIWIGSADMMHRNLDRRVKRWCESTRPNTSHTCVG